MRLAVNIERRSDLVASVSGYHPTSQSIDFIHQLAVAAMRGGGAFAIQGPFGVGKSSLAAFALNSLSCDPTIGLSSMTQYLSNRQEAALRSLARAGGLVPISIVGSSRPLALRVCEAVREYAKTIPARKRCRSLRLFMSLKPDRVDSDQLINLLRDLSIELKSGGCAGILLVIDEFGRQLEYMLSASGEDDFALLQNLAEATGFSSAPLSFVIIQHFGLEHYATGLLGKRRYEWEKVKGRFQEVILSNSDTDAAYIVSNVLREQNDQRSSFEGIEQNGKDLPQILLDEDYLSATSECFPLHPLTVALLSRLARLLGQQDRTIVGWLTSDMSTGFKSVCERSRHSWIYPESLYEHFFGNSLVLPANPAIAKRFAAIQNAYERIPDELNSDARVLFQTLAILGFCAGEGLRASRDAAVSCLWDGFPYDSCIEELLRSSLLVYRKFRNEYVVWEGSDYDILGKIGNITARLSIDIAFEMNHRTMEPILAHSHLIRTGNSRRAQVYWFNRNESFELDANEKAPRVLVWFDDSPDELKANDDVVGVASSRTLMNHLTESAAIKSLLAEDPELQDDEVARRELQLLHDFHEARVSMLSQNLLDSDLQWRVGEQHYERMQTAVSAAMDLAYTSSFELHNELVNRDRVSGQVTSALRKLFERLYTSLDSENVGIDKFPAERVIYESFLKKTGIHVQGSNGEWYLDLESQNLTIGLRCCLDEIRKICKEETDGQPESIEAIVHRLSCRPFGVKYTPGIILCVLVLLSDRNRYELYENGQFLPHWGPQTLLRILKAPSRFAMSMTSDLPIGKAFLREYAQILTSDSFFDETLVSITRRLLQRHANLSIYARRTGTVSMSAQQIRRAFEYSKSPADLLFKAIPDALGYRSIPTRNPKRSEFLHALKDVWEELEKADTDVLFRLQEVAKETTGTTALNDLREKVRKIAEAVLSESQMFHGFEVFLQCLVDDFTVDDLEWFTHLVDVGLGIQTPIRSWRDGHESQAEFLLRRNLLAMQEAAWMLSERKLDADARPIAVLWPDPSVKKSKSEFDTIYKELSIKLRELPRRERVAAVAQLVNELSEKA